MCVCVFSFKRKLRNESISFAIVEAEELGEEWHFGWSIKRRAHAAKEQHPRKQKSFLRGERKHHLTICPETNNICRPVRGQLFLGGKQFLQWIPTFLNCYLQKSPIWTKTTRPAREWLMFLDSWAKSLFRVWAEEKRREVPSDSHELHRHLDWAESIETSYVWSANTTSKTTIFADIPNLLLLSPELQHQASCPVATWKKHFPQGKSDRQTHTARENPQRSGVGLSAEDYRVTIGRIDEGLRLEGMVPGTWWHRRRAMGKFLFWGIPGFLLSREIQKEQKDPGLPCFFLPLTGLDRYELAYLLPQVLGLFRGSSEVVLLSTDVYRMVKHHSSNPC